MLRRIFITAANILLVLATVLTICHYYGRYATSAPDWVIIPAVLINYAPALIIVNVVNGVWKRIQQKKSIRHFLVTVANVLLVAWILLLIVFFGSHISAEQKDVILHSVLALLAVNAVNIYCIMAKKQKAEEASTPNTDA